MRRALLAAVCVAVGCAVAAGGVIAIGQGPRSEGPVRIGQPVEQPPAAGRPALGRIELRLADPDGGPGLATLVFAERERSGARARPAATCLETGVERAIRAYPILEGGSCRPAATVDALSLGVSSSSRGPTVIEGIAPENVRRLTLSGPGGTFELALSRSRAYAAAYSRREQGRATVTAHLADGTKRFRTVSLVPGPYSEGAVEAADPYGAAPWAAIARRRGAGARRGQTCAGFHQRPARTAAGRLTAPAFAAPVCGDLGRAPVVAHTMVLGPSDRPNSMQSAPAGKPRTILWGVASDLVGEVAVRGPDGERTLRLAAAGRAFLAVYPSSVRPDQLTLVLRLTDGSTQEHRAPRRLGATALNPPVRFVRTLRARRDGGVVRLTATLSRPVRRYRVFFLGRPLTMRRLAGTRAGYAASYDTTRGEYRARAGRGRTVVAAYTVCAPNCTAYRSVRLRIR